MARIKYNIPDNQFNGFPYGSKVNLKKDKDSLLTISGKTIKQLQDDGVFVFPPIPKNVDNERPVFSLNVDSNNNCTFYTNNIVGFIGIDGVQLNIVSRFDFDFQSKNPISNNFLIYMLGRAAGLNINLVNLESTNNNLDNFNLLELLFPKLLKEALSQGVYKEYKRVEHNDCRVKGPIDISRHIHNNIPFNGRLAYHTREHSMDNKVTQLIRHTIEYIRQGKAIFKSILSNDQKTTAAIQKLCNITPSYNCMERRKVINANLHNKISHPYYTKYTILQSLCLHILRGNKTSWGNGKTKLHGVLIDAAWLWEEYMAKVLSDNQSGLKHYVRTGHDFKLFRKDGNDFQQIIPDYYDEENRIVADAKYIPLDNTQHLNADRASAVYYKTLMYMLRFSCETGLLLFPSKKEIDPISYDVIDTNYKLHKVGMKISNEQKYSNFVDNMRSEECSFNNRIELFLKNNSSY